jgi:hypothetical protein
VIRAISGREEEGLTASPLFRTSIGSTALVRAPGRRARTRRHAPPGACLGDAVTRFAFIEFAFIEIAFISVNT